MDEIIIDTNFILTSIKNKIDLFYELENLFGVYEVIIGKQIFDELEKINLKKNEKFIDRENAGLAIQILNKKKIKIINFNTSDADAGIIKYVIKKPGTIVATLDRGLKKKIKEKNPGMRFLMMRGGKKIEIA